ncbi:hypothetical protein MferCBS31731_002392 [Microsporum ferrugineum]
MVSGNSSLSEEEMRKDTEILLMEARRAYETNNRRFHNDFARYLDCETPKTDSTRANVGAQLMSFKNCADVAHQISPRYDHFSNLSKLLKLHNIQPEVSDFFHENLTLSGRVEIPELAGEVRGENGQPQDGHREIFHECIDLLEDEANFYLREQVKKHGSETVYRSAFREYYIGEITNMMETHWRPDPRGQHIRRQAHDLCYQAINEVPFLATAERNMLIRTTGCFPEDTMAFLTSMTKTRLTYLMMREMAGLMEMQGRVETGQEEDADIEMDIAAGVNFAEIK